MWLYHQQICLQDLSRTQLEDAFLFSYSVTDGNNTVINASLGAKI